jgi:hypothetical protein
MRALLAWSLLVACVGSPTDTARPDPLGPLPLPAQVQTDRFRDAEACGQCHLADETTQVLHDATGANDSPVRLWRSSMMALAARDPYYLAVFAEELARAPSQTAATEALCTRCHGPAGSEELAASGGHVGFTELTSGTTPAALLARGGVTCTLCHQIDAANLGGDSSFSGKFVIGYGRKLYGRYPDPMTSPMQLIINYTPTQGVHIAEAELCGTCHTVLVPTAGGEVVEQATFLEWRASSFPGDAKPCQTCHVPVVDDAGHPISVPISVFPGGLAPRQPFGRHVFVGGNSYVLSLLADAVDWSGANVPAAELIASAARDDAHLATAAKLTVTDAHREADILVLTVRVENLTGHKLPTGYPSRRMWLHVKAGAFESGKVDARGAIVDAMGTALPAQPHRDLVLAADEVQIWESRLVDGNGQPTHRALDARRYGKDDRILPAGFSPSLADRARTAPVGTDGDATFVAGHDDVTYRILGVPAGASIDIELLYEAVAPEIVDAVDAAATPAGTRFVDLARARPVTPVVLAHGSQPAP